MKGTVTPEPPQLIVVSSEVPDTVKSPQRNKVNSVYFTVKYFSLWNIFLVGVDVDVADIKAT